MTSAITFLVGLLLVGGLLFLGASVLMGRGETQPPADLDRSPVELPDDRPVTGDDVRALRISVTARGYRMTEVDWLLDQFATALDERDAELASLRDRTASPTAASGFERPESSSELPTDPGAEPVVEEPAAGPSSEQSTEEVRRG